MQPTGRPPSHAMLLFHRFACEPKSVSATGGALSDNHPYYRSWEHDRFTNSSAPLLRIFRQGLRPKKTHAFTTRSGKNHKASGMSDTGVGGHTRAAGAGRLLDTAWSWPPRVPLRACTHQFTANGAPEDVCHPPTGESNVRQRLARRGGSGMSRRIATGNHHLTGGYRRPACL